MCPRESWSHAVLIAVRFPMPCTSGARRDPHCQVHTSLRTIQNWDHQVCKKRLDRDAASVEMSTLLLDHVAHSVQAWQVGGLRQKPNAFFAFARDYGINELPVIVQGLDLTMAATPTACNKIQLHNEWTEQILINDYKSTPFKN